MSVSYKDYYKLLDVDRKATKEEIGKSFKKLARKFHPDLNPGDTVAEEKFKELNEAYEVLKDPEKRKLYDQLGHNWQHGQQFQGAQGFEGFNFNGQNFGGGNFSDFFEVLFGNAARGSQGAHFGGDPFGFSGRPSKGKDMKATMFITLETAIKGGRQSISLSSAQGQRNLEVNVPAGIKEGAKLRLAGQGEASPMGGAAGDLILQINYQQHPLFSVDGENITYDLPLSPWESVFGLKATIPTLEGEIEMNIPAGTSSGRRFRLREKGLGKEGKRGDLMVRAMIRVPQKDDLSDEELELWEKLAQTSTFQAR